MPPIDAIKAEDITMFILRGAKTIEIFRYLEEHGCKVTKLTGELLEWADVPGTISIYKKKICWMGIWKSFQRPKAVREAAWIPFAFGQDLSGLEGTVLWICRSPFRRNHKRKNWYVDVSIIPETDPAAMDGEYRIEKFHCGGKGGQNVNKVETGVMVIHIPTGIVTQSTEERSQFRNKQKAMERMREKIAGLHREQQERQADAAWMEHYRIVRGNPVRVYEGDRFLLKQ